jgi:WD40 repeat protein
MITKHAIIIGVYFWGSLALIIPQRLAAQHENPCYQHYFEKGVEAFDRGDFNRAINFYEAARACLKEESNPEIDSWIKIARQSLNDALSEAKINSEVIRITAEALKAQPYDVTLALGLAHEACQISGNKNELAVDVRRTILETEENQYYSHTLRPGALISCLAISPDEKYVAAGLDNGDLKRVAIDGATNQDWETIGKVESKNKGWTNINALAYSPHGDAVLVTSSDSSATLWLLDGARSTIPIGKYFENVTDAAFSPTGDTMATSSGYYITLWKIENEWVKPKAYIKCRDIIRRIAYSPKGRFVIGAGNDHQVYWWDTRKNEPIILAGHNSGVTSVAFSRDGEFFCTGSADGEAIIWRSDNRQIVRRLKSHQGEINCIAFDPGNEFLLTGSMDKTVRLWDMEGNLIKILKGHQNYIVAVAFVNSGNTILSAGFEGEIRMWQLDAETLSQAYPHTAALTSACFSPDGRLVLTGSKDKTARLWQRDDDRLLHRFTYNDDVSSVAFHPDGKLIGIGVWDGNVSLRDTTGQLINTIFGRASSVTDVSFLKKSNMFISSHRGRTAILWSLPDVVKAEMNYHTGLVVAADFSFDDKYVISGSWDSTLVAFRIGSRDTIRLRTKSVVGSLAVSPTEPLVAATLGNNTIVYWNYIKKTWTSWNVPVYQTAIAFSPDGKQIATGDGFGYVRLWSTGGDSLFSFQAHPYGLTSICFSPDSKQILTTGNDNTALLWHLDGQLIRAFGGHNGPITTMAVSTNGQLIATGGEDGKVITWNLNRQITGIYRFSTAPISQLTISPDQSAIVAVDQLYQMIIWEIGKSSPRIIDTDIPVELVAFSPDGQTIAGTSPGGDCLLFDRNGKFRKKLINLGDNPIRAMYFAGNNNNLYIGLPDRLMRYDLVSGTTTEIISIIDHIGQSFAFTPAGDKTACADNWGNSAIRLYDNQGNEKEIFVVMPDVLAFDPSGAHLLCATSEGKTHLFDANTSSRKLMILESFNLGNNEEAAGVAFLGNSDTVVVCGIYSGPVFYRSYVKTLQKGANSFIQQLSLDQRQQYNIKLDFSDCYTSNNIELLKDCARYFELNNPDSALQLRQKIMQIKPSPQHKVDLALSYSNKLDAVTNPALLISGQQNVVQLLLEATKESPRTSSYRSLLHLAYSNLSWYQILAGRFHDALQSAETAVSMANVEDKGIVYTNLALSLLCLGGDENVQRAKSIYLEWKDKEWRDDTNFSYFRDAFLTDLEDSHIQDLAAKDPALKARIEEVKTTVLAETTD